MNPEITIKISMTGAEGTSADMMGTAPPAPVPLEQLGIHAAAAGPAAESLPTPMEPSALASLAEGAAGPAPYEVGAGGAGVGPEPMALERLAEAADQQPKYGEQPEPGGRPSGGRSKRK